MEFQKLIDHPGFMRACVLRPLSYVSIARAAALAGNTAKARTAYDSFFTLWKDADPDIPILKRARSESASLK